MNRFEKKSINPECITYSQMNLIFNSRMYYRRLTNWTRAYLLSRYFGIGNPDDIFSQLYYETIDLGNMLRIVHGREAAEKYSQLLSQFVIALRDVITAQLEGNPEGVDRNVNRLYQVAAERKAFIQSINPYASPEYENIFEIYIQYILEDANALAAGDYSKDIELYDQLTEHADKLGDAFAQGIYDYITSGPEERVVLPDGTQCITMDQMNAIFGVRMFWLELVTWVRNYMLSKYKGLGNAEEVRSRLLQVPADYVNNLKIIFGDQVAEDYIQLFYTYIELIEAFINAQLENNTEEVSRITQLLYQNADERAAFIASLNPVYWDEDEWRTRLYANLSSTLDEAATFLSGDNARNIDIFRTLMDQAESTSNYFAQGLFSYLTTENPETGETSLKP